MCLQKRYEIWKIVVTGERFLNRKKRANAMLVFNKGEKEYLGNWKSASCTSVCVNSIENNLLEFLSPLTRWVREGDLFWLSARYAAVTTRSQEASLKTKLYLEFSKVTKDGNFATS